MEKWVLRYAAVVIMAMLWRMERTCGIRFVIDKEECVSHKVETEGDTLHISFVVIEADSSWHFTDSDQGVDLLIKGPSGDLLHKFHDKTSEKYEFVVYKKGLYHFCFANKSPYLITIDFDVHLGHFTFYDQHAKDEHLAPLMEQISKLEEALYNIQFEQHWRWRLRLTARHW
ncbi:hypothetical protein GH714_023224 [Hevea brasiliensis]|uniref:GOLD domain-containing protein n=1 Tax=Hevea brasiliensis TaxID=3981 RepID=A0A6A6KWQ4_HEVBR|nr:hypothetical protein GH714_023224 [Hevea brasiliensis]